MDNNNYHILNGQTVIDGWEDLVCKNVELANTSVEVITDDTMPRTKEAAIDYLNEIGWLQEHDKVLSVKVGKWVPSKEYLWYSNCSVCNNWCIETSHIIREKWNYCPNCGSRMIYEENSVKK